MESEFNNELQSVTKDHNEKLERIIVRQNKMIDEYERKIKDEDLLNKDLERRVVRHIDNLVKMGTE
jgi:hypothetical protein